MFNPCENCGRAMEKEVSSGSIIFICQACLTTKKGSGWDLSINSGDMTYEGMTDQYANLIKFATEDPVNQLIKYFCEKCGRDYATQIRLGPKELVIIKCKCEFEKK